MAIKPILQPGDLHGLHRAIQEGRYRQVQFLVQMGADVNQSSKDGLKPLLRCCYVEKERIALIMFRFLRSKGADLHSKDGRGRSALSLALLNDKLTFVRYLCRDWEYDILDIDKQGFTALHHATDQGKFGASNIIIGTMKKRNMDMDTKTTDGMTPFLLACRRGEREIADLLIGIGGASTRHRDYIHHRNGEEWLAFAKQGASYKRPKTALTRLRDTTISRNSGQNDRSGLKLSARVKSCPNLYEDEEGESETLIRKDFHASRSSLFRTENERVLCHLLNSRGEQSHSSYRKSFLPECNKMANAKTWVHHERRNSSHNVAECESRAMTANGPRTRNRFQLAHDVVRSMLAMSKSLSRQNSRSNMRPGSAQSQVSSGPHEFRRTRSKAALISVQSEPTVPE